MLLLYVSDFSSSILASLVSALDVGPKIAYKKIYPIFFYMKPLNAIKKDVTTVNIPSKEYMSKVT